MMKIKKKRSFFFLFSSPFMAFKNPAESGEAEEERHEGTAYESHFGIIKNFL